jgi:hypothetical protein
MNKKLASIIAVLIILVFIAYIIFDIVSPEKENTSIKTEEKDLSAQDKWFIAKSFDPDAGPLKAVAVSQSGKIFLGGDGTLLRQNQ